MRRLGRYIFLFLVISLMAFGDSGSLNNIENMRFNGNPAQMVLDLRDNVSPTYKVDYDETNRLLLLEVKKTKASKSIVDKEINGNYIKAVTVVEYPDSMGFYIELQKNVEYRVSKRNSPSRIVVDFSKKVAKKEYTIIIDPGHGGKDSGALGSGGYKEKDLVLAVSKLVRDDLKKDFNVIMTRDRDVFISLSGRPRIGNKAKANLFVSIHANAAQNKSAHGFEVFHFSKKSSPYAAKVAAFENSFGEKYGEDTGSIAQVKGETEYKVNQEESIKVASSITSSYPKKLAMRNRGVHGANFAVLRGFDGPGILIELGFLSNNTELKKMRSSTNQKKMAKEIADNIRSYFY